MIHSTLPNPGATLRRMNRFRQVLGVLVKHGFGEALTRLRVWETYHIEKELLRREPRLTPSLTLSERLRLAIEELGPTFIKLGQMLSTRPDLVPPEIIKELKKLQYSVHYIPSQAVKDIIETELGRPVNAIFDSFEDIPLAAASLAQVHRAVLEGHQVVVKVQRPGVEEITAVDLDIIRRLAGLAESYWPELYLINIVGVVDEFAQDLRRELDFLMESHNMVRFAQNFADDESIHVPTVYTELCTRRLITMEFLDGINISDTARLQAAGYDLKLIAKRGGILGYKAIFEHGFFHADPHPGNILILPNNVIGLVDFGMMAVLSLRDRERMARLVSFITQRDDKRVARALSDLMESEDIVPAEELEPAMTAILKAYTDLPACELQLASMLFAMMRAILEHGGRFRPQLIWITKSIASQEDMACVLGSDFSFLDMGQPYAEKFLDQQLNPLLHPKELRYWLIDVLGLIRDLPYDAGIIMREIRKGRIKIEFEHVGLEPIRRTMDRIANRQSLTNIIVALLISSSVVVLARVPPFIGNISLLGFIGYIAAVILGLILIVNVIFRSDR